MAGHASEPSTRVPERSGGTYFPCLDAYRVMGMFMVLTIHAAFATGWLQRGRQPGVGWWYEFSAAVVSRFDIGAPMFFVLSGFLLYRPFVRSLLTGHTPTPLGRFYRRRALRIMPAYWVAVVGLSVFGALSAVVAIGIDGIWAWVANLFVLQAFGSTVPYGITQAWSIGVEISFYLALPLWAPLVHRAIARRTTPAGASHPVVDTGRFAAPVVVRLLAAAGALWVAGNVFRIVVVVAGPGWQGRSLNWLPMYLDLFAVGMLLAVVSAVVAEGAVVPRVFLWAGRHPVWCWALAGALLVAVAQMDPPPEPFMLNGAEYVPRQFGYGVIAAVWLAPAIFGDQRAGRLRAVLASRPMVYLADLSLSFYLWHLAFVDQAKEWTVPGYSQLEGLAVFTGSFPLVLVVATAATLVVSAVVYHLVELPFLRLKDGRVRATPPGGEPGGWVG